MFQEKLRNSLDIHVMGVPSNDIQESEHNQVLQQYE